MRQPTRTATILLLALAAALAATGCSAEGQRTQAGTTAGRTEPGAPATRPAGSDAADLRAILTAALADHTHRATTALRTTVHAGTGSDEAKAAMRTADAGARAVADVLGGVYGDEIGGQALELWRAQLRHFSDYARAAQRDDRAAMRAARTELDGVRIETGALLEGASPELPADVVAAELEPYVDDVLGVVDDAVDGRASVFDRLREAASHAPAVAKLLAAGVAAQRGDRFPGDPDAGASELRASLTGLLEDHVHLTSAAVTEGLRSGFGARRFRAASDSVDDNARALAAAIGTVYGDEARGQFLVLWRDHVEVLVDYARASAARDSRRKERALADLEAVGKELGTFLEGANPRLGADLVAAELAPHTEALVAAIRAAASESPKVFDRTADAASHVPGLAQVLADAIAAQYPRRFPTG